MINRKRCAVFVSLLFGLGSATSSLADLLDDDDPKPPAAETSIDSATKPTQPKDKPGHTGTTKAPKPTDDAVKSPSPHAKGPTTSANTTVIPPKNGKPVKPGKGKKEREPVHFESKGLKGLREKGMVELVQDVVVTQSELRMEAEHAQVFFDEASHEVVKVVAEGNVKINGVDENSGEKFKAFGNQAVFLNKDRIVVLEGNARLWRGDDSVIRSKKITYEMDTGWIKADRVAGELAPGDKDK